MICNFFFSIWIHSRRIKFPSAIANAFGILSIRIFVMLMRFYLCMSQGSSTSVWKTKATNPAGVKNSLLVPFDPFYSPILQKIDSIFTQLGFNEEGCRERLICSMYKNPVRFSPHSNLLSTELSRYARLIDMLYKYSRYGKENST